MKKTVIIIGVLVCSFALFSQLCASPVPTFFSAIKEAAFRWAHTLHDFGTIKKNVPVSHKFTFTNQGDEPLVITSVQASCGCTVTDYSKEPIPAGSEGYVKATYNAASLGVFSKTVTVNANTDASAVILSIKGVVVE